MSSIHIGFLLLAGFMIFLVVGSYYESKRNEACFKICMEEKKDKWVCRIACKCSSCE